MRVTKIPPPPIVELKKKLLGACDPALKVADLTQAVPAFQPPDVILDELQRAVREPGTCFYTDDQGTGILRTRIAARYARGRVDPEHVLVTAGANQAAFTLFTTLFKAGDRVLMPVPYYFNYDMALRMLDIEPVYVHRDFSKNNGELTLEDLAPHLHDVAGVILVNPDNPSGCVTSPETLAAIAETCRQKGVFLILDETYDSFTPEKKPCEKILDLVDLNDTLAVVNTFSKKFSLTGYRVGYVIASGKVLEEALKVQDTVIICAPAISQRAAACGLENAVDWMEERRCELNRRYSLFRKHFEQDVENFRIVSGGAFFAYVEHPFGGDGFSAAEKLAKEASVLVIPGSVFGPGQEKYLRISFAALADGDIEGVVKRFGRFQA